MSSMLTVNRIRNASIQCALALCMSLLPACTPMFGPLKTEKIYSTATIRVADTDVRFNLHHYQGGGSILWAWCANESTKKLSLGREVDTRGSGMVFNSKAAFVDEGWRLFTGFAMSDIKNISADDIARGVFRVLEPDVWIIEQNWSASITFDRCRSAHDIHLGGGNLSLANVVKPSPRGPRGTHWWRDQPFFATHKRYSDGRFCLAINKQYLLDENASWEVCSADVGKTWALVGTKAAG